MRPLLTPELVIARMLGGPVIVAMGRTDGHRVWTIDLGDRAICSDPVIWHGKLWFLTRRVDGLRPAHWRFTLQTFDLTTGLPLEVFELMHVRQSSHLSDVAQLALCDGYLVASHEGGTFCMNQDGRVVWVREHLTIPEDLGERWVLQDRHPVLYREGLVYATLPGMRTISCMELECGLQRWRAILPDLRGIVGLTEGVLIVRVEGAFVGLDAETGERLWRHATPDLCEATLCGAAGGFLYVRRLPVEGGNRVPELVWLDPTTGERRAGAPLASLAAAEPQLGPLVPHGNRLWAFSAPASNTADRQFIELIPGGALEISQRGESASP